MSDWVKAKIEWNDDNRHKVLFIGETHICEAGEDSGCGYDTPEAWISERKPPLQLAAAVTATFRWLRQNNL